MSFFTNRQVEALASAETVHVAALFKIEFASETIFAVEGAFGFEDVNGQEWRAMAAGVVRYSDIEFGAGVVAEKRTYTLNAGALGALSMSTVGQESEYRWRKISQLIQFFDTDNAPVGKPLHLHTGLMDRLSFSMSPDGGAELKMTTETEFARKNAAAYGYYTETDQKARYPSDLGLDRVSLLSLGELVKWPDF